MTLAQHLDVTAKAIRNHTESNALNGLERRRLVELADALNAEARIQRNPPARRPDDYSGILNAAGW